MGRARSHSGNVRPECRDHTTTEWRPDLGRQTRYELPITQEELGDAVALTPVHVNRTLKKLEQEGLIARTKRVIEITDWLELIKVADFDPRYLHLDRRMIEAKVA